MKHVNVESLKVIWEFIEGFYEMTTTCYEPYVEIQKEYGIVCTDMTFK